MKDRTWMLSLAGILALAFGVAGGDAMAGKGGTKGKPDGGGDGGGSPQQELIYTARDNGRGENLRGHILASPIDGDGVRVELTNPGWGTVRQLSWSPDGGAIAYLSGFDEAVIVDRASGNQTVLATGLLGDQAPRWSGRRGSDGAFLPYDDQLFVLTGWRDWGPRPWGDPFTLRSRNLEILPADPAGAPHALAQLTTYGWWFGTDGNGSLMSTSEGAFDGRWVADRSEATDRAWIIYRYSKRTYLAPPGDEWADQTYTYWDVYETRVMTLDVSSWPSISIEADELLVDTSGDAFDFDEFGYVSQDGHTMAWLDLDGDGLLHTVGLDVEPVGGIVGAEPTLVVNPSDGATYAPPSGYTPVGSKDAAISHFGDYLAIVVHDSRGEDVVFVLDRASGAWTNVSKNKYNVTHFGYGLAFGPPPAEE